MFACASIGTGRKSLLELVVIEAGRLEQAARGVHRDPRLHRHVAHAAVGRRDVEVLAAPAARKHLERVARGTFLVHDDRGRRALLRRDLVLVRPPAVVRHRTAAEHGRVERARIVRVGDRRIVHQHHDRLAGHVDALVIVPAVLRRQDAVADEDEIAVLDVDHRHRAARRRHEIGRAAQRHALPLHRDRRGDRRRDADERHVLDPGAVRIAGLQAHRLELLRQVPDRLLLTRRTRRTTLEGVGGEHLRVAEQVLGRDARERGGRVERRLVGRRRIAVGPGTGGQGNDERGRGQQRVIAVLVHSAARETWTQGRASVRVRLP
jgi:hypothetical protein